MLDTLKSVRPELVEGSHERDSSQTISLVSLVTTPEESYADYQPSSFAEYHGQHEVKERLALYTAAAKQRSEPLDHILLFGPPGLGKTTLAQIMAHERGVGIRICSGPTLERAGDLVSILSSMERNDILFIDEIHRVPAAVEEVLYTAMEQFRVDMIIGQGAGARSVNLPINPFTLVGATTKTGMISAPLRSRFGITERLDLYPVEDLRAIVIAYGTHVNLTLAPDAATHIAAAARGTPRIAKKILRRVRDFAQMRHNNIVDAEIAQKALSFLGIDAEGLTAIDHRILRTLLNNFHGGPAGLETLAAIIGEDGQTIEDVYEPHLMRCGYLEKTPRGRQIPHAIRARIIQWYGGQQVLV